MKLFPVEVPCVTFLFYEAWYCRIIYHILGLCKCMYMVHIQMFCRSLVLVSVKLFTNITIYFPWKFCKLPENDPFNIFHIFIDKSMLLNI